MAIGAASDSVEALPTYHREAFKAKDWPIVQRRTEPTVETVKEGCTRLAHQLQNLRKEVADVSAKLSGFKKGREIPEVIQPWDYPSLERSKGEAPQTPEPRSMMADLDFETKDAANLDISTRALFAIGHGLDGAVREIRAAKATLQAIADDSDLRKEFKDWKDGH